MIDWTKPIRYKNPPYTVLRFLGKNNIFAAVQEETDGYIGLVNVETGCASDLINSVENVPIKRKQITFTETGEIRLPKKGEWLFSDIGNLIEAAEDFTISKHPIYTRTDYEVNR